MSIKGYKSQGTNKELPGRVMDPPLVTSGVIRSNLPPQVQLAYGPNPELRKGYELAKTNVD